MACCMGYADDAMPSDDASRQLAARHPLAAIPGILAGAAGPQEGALLARLKGRNNLAYYSVNISYGDKGPLRWISRCRLCSWFALATDAGEELFHEDVSATVGRKRKAQSAPVRGGSRGTHRVARSTSGSAGACFQSCSGRSAILEIWGGVVDGLCKRVKMDLGG